MEVLSLNIKGRLLPVEVSKSGRKLRLRPLASCPSELKTEIKCLRGAEWDFASKSWRVTDCRRNWIQLEALQGKIPPELERYERDLETVETARSLYAHQREMLAFAWTRRCCLLAAEMGTGKTLTVIELMERVGGRWLYVCPAKVKPAITLELKKWGCQVTPTLTSYASLHKFVGGPAFDGVIFDESSKIKTPSAQRTKAAQIIADSVRMRGGFVVLLTGTPAPKNPCDWWSQAEIACPGYLRESSRTNLERRLAIYEKLDLGNRVVPNVVGWHEDEVELLGRRLQGLVQVHYAKDCLDLPDLLFDVQELEPSASTLRAAKTIAETALSGIEALNKLRQLSDGFQYVEDGEPLKGSTPKDDALRAILANNEETGRVVIGAAYRASIDRVVDLCMGEGWNVLRCDGRGYWTDLAIKPELLLSEFDRATQTETPARLAFVCHPASGGYGLTLHAARTTVAYSNSFNAEERWQFEKRIHRSGMSDRGATVIDLCHLPTDQFVLSNLQRKRDLQDVTLEEIRACL